MSQDPLVICHVLSEDFGALKQAERWWWLTTIPELVQSVSQLVALTDAAVGFANGADGEAATLTMIQEMAKELRGHRVPFLDRDTEPHPPRESLRFAKRLAGGTSPPSEFVAKHIEAMKAAIRARIEACSLGWEVATIALMEAIEIVMAVADREGGARILDSVADWLSNQLSDSPVPADVEICTFADMATMHPSEMADIGMVCFEIGRAGELDETRAAASAKSLLTNVARYPRVQNMLSINGYDSDTRELWDIPEVKQFIAWMVASFSAAGRKLTELHLVPQSLTLLRACIGELVVTSRDPITRQYTMMPKT